MFWTPCGSGGGWWVDGGWDLGGWGWGVVGGAPQPAHAHMHTCACTRAHGKHDNFMQMAASIGFLGNPWEFPMMSYAHARACACMCVHVWGTPSHHPPSPSTHPPPPKGDPWNHSKLNST